MFINFTTVFLWTGSYRKNRSQNHANVPSAKMESNSRELGVFFSITKETCLPLLGTWTCSDLMNLKCTTPSKWSRRNSASFSRQGPPSGFLCSSHQRISFIYKEMTQCQEASFQSFVINFYVGEKKSETCEIQSKRFIRLYIFHALLYACYSHSQCLLQTPPEVESEALSLGHAVFQKYFWFISLYSWQKLSKRLCQTFRTVQKEDEDSVLASGQSHADCTATVCSVSGVSHWKD